jgi:PAS domain S-box-containing protein
MADTVELEPTYHPKPAIDSYSARQIIDNLPVAAYTCDYKGFITQYNQAAETLWGRAPELGKEQWCGALNIFNSEGSDLPIQDCTMAKTLKAGVAVLGSETVIQRPDGTQRHVIPHPRLIHDELGNIAGAINVLIDVTGARQKDEQAARFTAIVQSSDDAIISKTLQGIVTSWNPAAERIFGYTAAEMVGQSITKVIPDDRLDEEPQILGRIRNGERVDHFETIRRRKDGSMVDISLTISPVKNDQGEIIGVSKIGRDITAQKKGEHALSENAARFRMAVASTRLGTWEFAPQTGDLSWSEECKRIYGVPANLQIDMSFFADHIYPEDAEFARKNIEEALDPSGSGDYDIQFRIVRYDDKRIRWIRSQGKVFFNEKKSAEKFIGTVLDITEEKSVREKLEQLIQERTKELKSTNIALATSNKELEQFAYVASHDLQEPLRKINAFGDMLKNRYAEALSREGADLIGRMQSASDRMKELIESLLAYSRVSNNSAEHDVVDLQRIANEVVNDLEMAVKDKKARITIDKLPAIQGQPSQLRQLFQNLIGNSLKFLKADATPEITITSHLVSGKDSNLTVSIPDQEKLFQQIEFRDNGIGFEQEYASRIFMLFERLHGRTEYPGSGMGLSIVQKIVNNHNGYIAAEGKPGEGALFRILLPV